MTRGQRPYLPRAVRRHDDGDVDEVAVTRAVSGDLSVRLTGTETAIAVRRLAARGLSTAETSWLLGISNRHVSRVRTATREQATA